MTTQYKHPKLKELYDWLLENPVPNFTNSFWKDPHKDNTYCLIGWAAENNMFGLCFAEFADTIPVLQSDMNTFDPFEAIARAFNIKLKLAIKLFSAKNTYWSYKKCMKHLKKKALKTNEQVQT